MAAISFFDSGRLIVNVDVLFSLSIEWIAEEFAITLPPTIEPSISVFGDLPHGGIQEP